MTNGRDLTYLPAGYYSPDTAALPVAIDYPAALALRQMTAQHDE
jgi:hypothetical protein